MHARLCSKTTCQRPAVYSLTYDYQGCSIAIGPLSLEADPNSYDLCQTHGEHLTPPSGWKLYRHDLLRGVNAGNGMPSTTGSDSADSHRVRQ
ncbi:DUF3499 family protein [Lysinibacter sp. HNR]|uniref:DUF3499 family protein n=1 Tax=Lysinibacter sp. HNR TaxID=3031408 RepID=UPI002435EF2C|nr:DUF3499 family protein [Lysinibacter sp. HNR]WGD38106.1 DUF3499 family protein [Lysinibacter sp. HNR]